MCLSQFLIARVPTNPEFQLPLTWSETVPWWFINKAYHFLGRRPPPSVIIGLPSSDKNAQDPSKLPEFVKFGETLYTFLQSESGRIVVTTFGDLSHNHSNSTTLFPYYKGAKVFDNSCLSWASERIDETNFIKKTLDLMENGYRTRYLYSCGFRGLVTLQGVINELILEGDGYAQGSVVGYSYPTYFGMMVAYFEIF